MSEHKGGELEDAVEGLAIADEEVLAASSKVSDEDARFDEIVGAIEDIMMDPTFQGPQEEFCRENCGVFEDSDENKLEYTTLFERYTELTESLLLKKLQEALPDFDMEAFMGMVVERKDQVSGDVFDMLLSFGDFSEFKALMLSYKSQAAFDAGDTSALCLGPSVTSVSAGVATEAAGGGTGAGAGAGATA